MSTWPRKLQQFPLTAHAMQGYEISEEEKTVSLDEFRKRFVDTEGRVLYVLILASGLVVWVLTTCFTTVAST